MKRCSIIEYEEGIVVEFYDQQSKERIEYKFDCWDEALEALPGLLTLKKESKYNE